jgi:hypothetical protein
MWLVNEAVTTCFAGNAPLLRKLEALEKSLSQDAKIVIPSGSGLVNVIGGMAGALPMTKQRTGLIRSSVIERSSQQEAKDLSCESPCYLGSHCTPSPLEESLPM